MVFTDVFLISNYKILRFNQVKMRASNSDSVESFIADDFPKYDDDQYPGNGNDSGKETAVFFI